MGNLAAARHTGAWQATNIPVPGYPWIPVSLERRSLRSVAFGRAPLSLAGSLASGCRRDDGRELAGGVLASLEWRRWFSAAAEISCPALHPTRRPILAKCPACGCSRLFPTLPYNVGGGNSYHIGDSYWTPRRITQVTGPGARTGLGALGLQPRGLRAWVGVPPRPWFRRAGNSPRTQAPEGDLPATAATGGPAGAAPTG